MESSYHWWTSTNSWAVSDPMHPVSIGIDRANNAASQRRMERQVCTECRGLSSWFNHNGERTGMFGSMSPQPTISLDEDVNSLVWPWTRLPSATSKLLSEYHSLLKMYSLGSPWYALSHVIRTGLCIRPWKLNLKNDLLRRRYDSLKYDIKKIEEGEELFSWSYDRFSSRTSVVYDVSLRKLASTAWSTTRRL